MRFKRLVVLLATFAVLFTAAAAQAQQVYWLDTRFATPSVNRANVDGTGRVTLALPPGSLPEGLALDRARASIYWTEATFTGARVRRSGLGLLAATDVVTGGSAMRGLAMGGTTTPLLWTTSNTVIGPAMRTAALDGTGQSVLATFGVAGSNPRGIAYQPPPSEFIFVADIDGIYRYNALGSGGMLTPLPIGNRPYGIAADALNSRVYWAEYASGRIQRCATGGGSVVTLLSGLPNPTYLTLDVPGGKMYWVESGAGTQRIRRANLDGSGIQLLNLPVTSYGGIAVVPGGVASAPDESPVLVLALAAVSPNPARREARLAFALPRAQRVRLSVLDVQGREVALLSDGEFAAGHHDFTWAVGTANAGVYFARLRTEGRILVQRFTVLR